VLSEDVGSHNISIVEKSLYCLPFYYSKSQIFALKDAEDLSTFLEIKAVTEEDKLIEAGFEFVRYSETEQVAIYRKPK